MRRRKSILGPSLLLGIVGAMAVSQLRAADHKTDQGPWESLTKLAKGTRVRVVYGRSESVEGRFVAASDDKLTIEVHYKRSKAVTEEMLSPSGVLKVSVRRFSPTKTALLAALGAGMGALVAGYDCTKYGPYYYPNGSSCEQGHWRSSTTIGIGAGVGAAAMGLLGALVAPDYKEVYARPAELQRRPVRESQELAPPDTQAQPQQPAAGEDIKQQLLEAAEKGDSVAVETLLARGADRNAKVKEGWRVPMIAAFKNSLGQNTGLDGIEGGQAEGLQQHR